MFGVAAMLALKYSYNLSMLDNADIQKQFFIYKQSRVYSW